MKTNRFLYETRPLAHPENIVSGKCYRFTVLTPSLIRLEYAADGIFEDRASQSIFFRDLPAVSFETAHRGELLTVETENLLLTYTENAPFSAKTLALRLKTEPGSVWHFGEEFEDLGGTAATLDRANGEIPIGRGVCSRNGFSVLDDGDRMLLGDDGWVEVRRPNTRDLYFFGYGFDYRGAVRDLYRLTGAPTMLPAYALGNWWSRYHRYTQKEYEALILRFEEEDVPFSVSVVDMDWHITEIPEELKTDDGEAFNNGWTGYSWNRDLFPDPKAFLRFLKEHDLYTSLNLHPATGVGPHEDMYPAMARAVGIDPATKKRVKLDILSPDFMEKYFDILHHPYEEDGVDFWWMDWQQGGDYWWIHEPNENGVLRDEREVLDPLWMLNHLHIADIKRNGKRPMFFSRFSGPGSHRYPVGFSGDTLITWPSLDFQPYFTATATNIGYPWWSHDIGGHMDGYRDDELIARWIQLGVFSPINRLHSSASDFIRKEPWCFDEKTGGLIKDCLRLRHALFPYLYTMNECCHRALLSPIEPMYYQYPKVSAAYAVKNQFFFGSELMVAPITSPDSPLTKMGKTTVFFPRGDWFDFFDGTHYASKKDRTLTVARPLDRYPVFAKAGAIIPMQESRKLHAGEDLTVVVFPGADNRFTLYEDAGDGDGYTRGEYATTAFSLSFGERAIFRSERPAGDLSLLPARRKFRFVLRGFGKELCVAAEVNGIPYAAAPCYDEKTRSLILTVEAETASEIVLTLDGAYFAENEPLAVRATKILQRAQIGTAQKHAILDALEKSGSLSDRLYFMSYAAATSPAHEELVAALAEQMLLLEE